MCRLLKQQQINSENNNIVYKIKILIKLKHQLIKPRLQCMANLRPASCLQSAIVYRSLSLILQLPQRDRRTCVTSV